jgi:hypothetical protein
VGCRQLRSLYSRVHGDAFAGAHAHHRPHQTNREPKMSLEAKVVESQGVDRIRPSDAAPPVPIPAGHVGPVVLPGTGRLVWWTGRVAIGLRHEPPQRYGVPSQSALWVQELMLAA